jgi:hypothetical protein
VTIGDAIVWTVGIAAGSCFAITLLCIACAATFPLYAKHFVRGMNKAFEEMEK